MNFKKICEQELLFLPIYFSTKFLQHIIRTRTLLLSILSLDIRNNYINGPSCKMTKEKTIHVREINHEIFCFLIRTRSPTTSIDDFYFLSIKLDITKWLYANVCSRMHVIKIVNLRVCLLVKRHNLIGFRRKIIYLAF